MRVIVLVELSLIQKNLMRRGCGSDGIGIGIGSVVDEFQTFDVDGMAIGTLLCQKKFGENSKVDP